MRLPTTRDFSNMFPDGVGECISVYRDWYRKRPTETMLKVISENYSPESQKVQEMFTSFELGRQDAYQTLTDFITAMCWQVGAIRFFMELHGLEQLGDSEYERLTATVEDNQKKVADQFEKMGKMWGFQLEKLPDNAGLDLRLKAGAITQL